MELPGTPAVLGSGKFLGSHTPQAACHLQAPVPPHPLQSFLATGEGAQTGRLALPRTSGQLHSRAGVQLGQRDGGRRGECWFIPVSPRAEASMAVPQCSLDLVDRRDCRTCFMRGERKSGVGENGGLGPHLLEIRRLGEEESWPW